jgi:hypothetical protein
MPEDKSWCLLLFLPFLFPLPPPLTLLSFLFFETRPNYVGLAGLELTEILSPLTLKG